MKFISNHQSPVSVPPQNTGVGKVYERAGCFYVRVAGSMVVQSAADKEGYPYLFLRVSDACIVCFKNDEVTFTEVGVAAVTTQE